MKVKWKNPKVKRELVEIMESSGPEAAARHFGVSISSVRLAYRRRNGDPYTGKSKKRGPYKTKTKSFKASTLRDNPFEIKDDLMFTGTRGGENNPLIQGLFEQVRKLPVGDIRVSVNIPITVAPEKKDASNLILQLRRLIENVTDKSDRNITFVTKAIYAHGTEKYLGTRLWRKS